MDTFDARQVETALHYQLLIEKLKEGFKKEITTPQRHHHNYPNPPSSDPSALLLMPAWEPGSNLGVKVVNVTPANGEIGLPSIHGIYLYFDARTGIPLALMDSNMITKKRTAATSALASSYLSREDSKTLLVVGTGALAPEMIKAHCQVRKIRKVWVWGRDIKKAQEITSNLDIPEVEINEMEDLEKGVRESDIVSTATLSRTALIKGEWLNEGQHVDLVGSYLPDSREADDDVILWSSVFIDSYEGAPVESGDLAIPIKEGVISMDHIKGDLFEICRRNQNMRISPKEITCFKSVGHALEDLVAAQIVYDTYNKEQKNEP